VPDSARGIGARRPRAASARGIGARHPPAASARSLGIQAIGRDSGWNARKRPESCAFA